jgi:hypothetical protein
MTGRLPSGGRPVCFSNIRQGWFPCVLNVLAFALSGLLETLFNLLEPSGGCVSQVIPSYRVGTMHTV